MSTVVDNDKYIINGSTLSDIGDALRAKNIIAPTKKVTQQVCCYRTYYAPSRNNYGDYEETTTLTEWYIQYNQYGINYGYPVPQFSYVRIYRETANSYPMKVNGSSLDAGSSVIVSLPCTLLFEGNSTFYVKFYPLDSNQREIPWDSSYYYPSNPNDYNKYYYKENVTKQVPNLIAVGNIAQSITDMAASSQTIYIGDANYSGATPQMIQYSENIYRVLDSRNYQSDIYTTWDNIDPEKILMMWCYYGGAYAYQHLYIRDVTGFMTNASKSKYFFPNIEWATPEQACQNYNTSTSSPAINPSGQNSSKYYSFSFDTTTKKLYFSHKVTAYTPNQTLTTKYIGGSGSMVKAGVPFIIICEN